MATTTINTRLSLRTDTSANWAASTLVLLKGEPAIEITEDGGFKFKFGDGVKTYPNLPYVTLTATEISSLITDGSIQSISLAGGTNNGTLKLTVDGKATDNIAVKGLGSAAYTNTNAYAAASHSHAITNVTGLQKALDGKAAASHTHDDRYYTETEINTKLNGKANSSHTHASADITSLDVSKLTGTIDIARLPAGALERCVVVTDDTARFKLTTTDIQKGDTVKVTGTGKMYFVVDDSKLTSEGGYEVYTAGSATSVPWSGVTGKPSTFTPSAHNQAISTITGLQAALDGKASSSHTHSQYYDGNVSRTANTVLAAPNGSAGGATFRALVAADIPTLTKSKISDFPAALKNPNSLVIKLNGGSTEGTNMFTYDGSGAKSLSITPSSIGAAAASHTHNYAGSSSAGGAATSAVVLSTARNFSITGGAVAAAVSFNGNANVALSVSSLNADYLVNGSNTLILSCGGAS